MTLEIKPVGGEFAVGQTNIGVQNLDRSIIRSFKVGRGRRLEQEFSHQAPSGLYHYFHFGETERMYPFDLMCLMVGMEVSITNEAEVFGMMRVCGHVGSLEQMLHILYEVAYGNNPLQLPSVMDPIIFFIAGEGKSILLFEASWHATDHSGKQCEWEVREVTGHDRTVYRVADVVLFNFLP